MVVTQTLLCKCWNWQFSGETRKHRLYHAAYDFYYSRDILFSPSLSAYILFSLVPVVSITMIGGFCYETGSTGGRHVWMMRQTGIQVLCTEQRQIEIIFLSVRLLWCTHYCRDDICEKSERFIIVSTTWLMGT